MFDCIWEVPVSQASPVCGWFLPQFCQLIDVNSWRRESLWQTDPWGLDLGKVCMHKNMCKRDKWSKADLLTKWTEQHTFAIKHAIIGTPADYGNVLYTGRRGCKFYYLALTMGFIWLWSMFLYWARLKGRCKLSQCYAEMAAVIVARMRPRCNDRWMRKIIIGAHDNIWTFRNKSGRDTFLSSNDLRAELEPVTKKSHISNGKETFQHCIVLHKCHSSAPRQLLAVLGSPE